MEFLKNVINIMEKINLATKNSPLTPLKQYKFTKLLK